MRNHGAAIVLCVAAMLASGCVGLGPDEDPAGDDAVQATAVGPIDVARLSQPVFDLAGIVEAWIPSHDGVTLHAAEYHPDVPDGTKTPVVIQLSPYFGNLDAEAQAATMDDYFVGLLVSRGYTVVYASVRGTGYSGGCYELGGANEIQDAYELVKAYHEADWSNGNVGLIGVSYPGTTPWQAAITAPPGLKTIVPISGISDMYRYMFIDGAAYTHGPLFPTYYTAMVDWTTLARNGADPVHITPLLEAACPDVAARIAKGYQTWADGDHDAFWDERDYGARVGNVTTAVFLVHGLQDWNVDPDNGVPLFDSLPAPKKAWLGQWAHNLPWRNSYNDEWDRHDFNVTLVAWFDQHLKGVETGVLSEPPVLVQDSQGHWHREAAWPPADTMRHRSFLAPDGALADAPAEGADAARMGPVPAGVLPLSAGPLAMVEESGTLRYTSEPMGQDTSVVGRPTLTLNVTIDAPTAHLLADLYDPDAKEHAWLGHAILDLAHRDGRDQGTPMPDGSPVPVTMVFFPLDAFVPQGHRIQLVLRAEDAGWIWPSPYRPTYEIVLDAATPASLAYDVRHAPVFEEAPEQDAVPWSA